MSLADNLRDLENHARDFAERRGFTYTVLATDTTDVIGCVYIYPSRPGTAGEWPATVIMGACGSRGARPGAVPRGLRMARTRVAVRRNRVRSAELTVSRRGVPPAAAGLCEQAASQLESAERLARRIPFRPDKPSKRS